MSVCSSLNHSLPDVECFSGLEYDKADSYRITLWARCPTNVWDGKHLRSDGASKLTTEPVSTVDIPRGTGL